MTLGMTSFKISVNWQESSCSDPLEAAVFGELDISVDGISLSRFEDGLLTAVSVFPLFVWIITNWNELLYEDQDPRSGFSGRKSRTDWLETHNLYQNREGWTYPDLSLFGTHDRAHYVSTPMPGFGLDKQGIVPVVDMKHALWVFVEDCFKRLGEFRDHSEVKELREIWEGLHTNSGEF